MMIARAAIFVAVVALGGCAHDWSRLEFTSNNPVAVVANCIGERWGQHYPDVSITPYGSGLSVQANFGTTLPIQARILWTAYGSWVSFATDHDELVLRGHPAIGVARACAA